eukprot:2650932-Amphidinium_carterae.1
MAQIPVTCSSIENLSTAGKLVNTALANIPNSMKLSPNMQENKRLRAIHVGFAGLEFNLNALQCPECPSWSTSDREPTKVYSPLKS